jgi:serine/threonine protein kinase/tetratricopeptide (TPR) repeat protein
MKCPQCDFDNPSGTRFCGHCGSPLYPQEKISAAPDETLLMPLKELAPGTLFARRYDVIEELGKGGMGRVYKVFDKKIKEKVALKLLRPEISADEETVERFSNELKYARKIVHKNVCRMFDLGEEEGTHYITMEYVSGEDLKSMIRMMGRLSPGQAVSIAKQVCEGLAEAHKIGVIHRDLKPQNIMIDREGNARIMDFGIARSLKAKGITDGGIIIGTPEYMSPEQVEGKEIDQLADIYALGVILFEMLTGKVPFEGDTPLSIAVKHKTEVPQDPRNLNAQVPPDLSQLILKCLEKEKRNRPQSAEEVSSQLAGIEQEVPTAEKVLPQRKPFTSREIKGGFSTRWRWIAAVIVVAMAVVLAFLFLRKEKPTSAPQQANKRLVVVPFENQGAPEDEYFADGMTDEITARLSSISHLEVIARASAIQYKKTDKTPQKIGEELGVGYILYGTVRWQKQTGGTSQVRVTPSLVRVSDATQIWANPYDESIAQVFQVQSEIAKRVAEALNIALLGPERQALETKLTNSPEAYDYYLRGREYINQGSANRINIMLSIEMLEKAVQLDPRFIHAFASLARDHSLMYWYYYDHTQERASKSKAAVDQALFLGPNLPETHFALGIYYYSCQLDFEHALEQLLLALEKQPRNSEILEYIAYVKRRQGKLDENIANLKKALEIDPRSVNITRNLGHTYFLMRNYIEGERYYQDAISLSPDYLASYIDPSASISFLYLSWQGNTAKARKVLEEALKKTVSLDDENHAYFLWATMDIYDRDFQGALKRLSLMPGETLDSQFYFVPKNQLNAQIYGLMNNREKERDYYNADKLDLENKIKAEPEDSRFHSALGIAYAGLGLKDKAVQEAVKATELLPVAKEFWRGACRVKNLAQVYVMVGEYDKALDKIEYLLSIPGELSVPLLKIDPVWAPLRTHPRFQKLINE